MRGICFARAPDRRCTILRVRRCRGYDRCSFYRTRYELDHSDFLCRKRLHHLPEEQRRYLLNKYIYQKRMKKR